MIESVAGGIGMPRTESAQLDAMYKLRDSMDNLKESIVPIRTALTNLADSIIKESANSKLMQRWLLIWTAVMAVATVVQVATLILK
jgi:hypothetical protein